MVVVLLVKYSIVYMYMYIQWQALIHNLNHTWSSSSSGVVYIHVI